MDQTEGRERFCLLDDHRQTGSRLDHEPTNQPDPTHAHTLTKRNSSFVLINLLFFFATLSIAITIITIAMSGLPAVLKATEEDIKLLLSAQSHLGTKNADVHMESYVWKRRGDGNDWGLFAVCFSSRVGVSGSSVATSNWDT